MTAQSPEEVRAEPAFTLTTYEGVTTAYYSAEELCRVVNAEKANALLSAADRAPEMLPPDSRFPLGERRLSYADGCEDFEEFLRAEAKRISRDEQEASDAQ